MNPLSLYFHIPFCTKKCPYCHFYVIPHRASFQSLLQEGLFLEWQARRCHVLGKSIISIYFGGGTPSLFPEGVETILQWIRRDVDLGADVEITLEANPEGCTKELLTRFRKVGINRLSLGVQSLDTRSLQVLERTHSAEEAIQAIRLAKEVGFDNLSIDLMYDLPDQTEASWSFTCDRALEMPIDHISLYNLTIEPHTSFERRKNTLKIPEGQTSLRLLEIALDKFETRGWQRYEISAFAKEEKKSRHNLGYWTARPFLGFGPSAFSYFQGERFRNISHLYRYVRSLREGRLPIDLLEKLPYPKNVQELFAIRLRLIEGAEVPDVLEDVVASLVKQGLLVREGPLAKLSQKGLLFYDSVAAEIV